MNGANGRTAKPQDPVEMEQAARVGGDQIFRAGGFGVAGFDFAHGRGNHAEFHGKRAAEAAALLARR